jgi:hypothetical protein
VMADEPDTGVTTDTANSEAAKWRRQLRSVEVERDQLAAQLDATHRVMVETEAAARFVEPRDVWALTSIDAMRGDDGLVDLERVQAEFERIEGDRPHWKKPPPAPPVEPESRFPEIHQGARQSEPPEPPTFGDQLKNLGRR